MIMFGIKFTGEIPFRYIYIHGLIQDQDGCKMSKTKGNIIDPLDLINGIDIENLIKKRTAALMQPQMKKKIEITTKAQFSNGIPAYGADALRFTFCASATTNRNIRFDLNTIKKYRNFCNKIWNASRYVLMHTKTHLDYEITNQTFTPISTIDKWIISLWQ